MIAVLLALAAQTQTYDIGEVDLFGQTGTDVAKIRQALPIHAGDKLGIDDYLKRKQEVEDAVRSVIGMPATDFAMVSFDTNNKTMIFVGIPGPTIRGRKLLPTLTADIALPGQGLKFYQDDMSHLMHALQTGQAKEDDSNGYALSNDPDMHEAQLHMRDYALENEPAVRNVLRNSKLVEQRQAAAMLLGYAKRSKSQIDELARATADPDGGVRNNATRALAVMAEGVPSTRSMIPAEPFIDMVCSGTWTDRNKGGWVLEALTKSRDPKLLKEVWERARFSLKEIAEWTNFPHAESGLEILGRAEGISESKLKELMDKQERRVIIDAVK